MSMSMSDVWHIPVTRDELIELTEEAILAASIRSVYVRDSLLHVASTAPRVAALVNRAQCNGTVCGCPAVQARLPDYTSTFGSTFDGLVMRAFWPEYEIGPRAIILVVSAEDPPVLPEEEEIP
jgi:hypothetical protein